MFNKISPKEMNFNAFTTIGDEWMLITCEKEGKVNAMTASWGGLGILWGKPVAYIFIRPQRYTKEFVDNNDKLSLCVLPEQFRNELKYFGTISGRDEDKIKKANLTVAHENGVPYFEESNKVFVCKKLYADEIKESKFMDINLSKSMYPQEDFHTMYIVEIEDVLVK